MSLRAAATTLTGVSASGSRRRDGRSRASGMRSRWPAGADDLRLVALDRGDRSVHAERRRLDRVAGRERPGQRQRLVERADRPLGPRGSLRGRAEPAVALAARRRRLRAAPS